MFKNKKVVVTLIVVLVVAVLIGGYFFMANKSKAPDDEDTGTQQDSAQSISPEEIGLSMAASPDKKKVKFSLEKAQGITDIEYELTYEADSTAQEQSEGGEDRVQRGITGQAQVSEGETSYESEWLDLGSCSKNVCRYDTGVKKIDLTLKITKGGKTYQAVSSLDLK